MSERRTAILEKIETERVRQFHLPGSEFDVRNFPNDWVAIATHYLCDAVRRGGTAPTREDFQDSLVKAAAVIVAALEHVDLMNSKDHFRNEE